MAALLPAGKQIYFGNNGLPLAGGRVLTFESGTTTPKATYTDAAETVENANPVILDSRGEAVIFWSGSYKVELQDADENTIWVVDGLDDQTPQWRTGPAGSLIVPSGTTLQRDDPAEIGYFRHNLTTDNFEGYGSDGWRDFVSVDENGVVNRDLVLENLNGNGISRCRNILLNGDMSHWQLGTSATAQNMGAAMPYSADLWILRGNNGMQTDWARDTDTPDKRIPFSLKLVNLTGTPASTITYSVAIRMDGYDVLPLYGKTFTLSFWMKATVTGVFSVYFKGHAVGSTFNTWIDEVNYASANTWQKMTITVQGGIDNTIGDWLTAGGAPIQFEVGLVLDAGAAKKTSAIRGWLNSTSLDTSTNQYAWSIAPVGAEIKITGFQLEPGPVATDFTTLPKALEAAAIRQYFEVVSFKANQMVGAGMATSTISLTVPVPITPKRVYTGSLIVFSRLNHPNWRYNATAPVTNTGFTFSVFNNELGQAMITMPGTFTANTAYRIHLASDADGAVLFAWS